MGVSEYMEGEVVTIMFRMACGVHYLATELDGSKVYLGIRMVAHHCKTTYSFSCS